MTSASNCWRLAIWVDPGAHLQIPQLGIADFLLEDLFQQVIPAFPGVLTQALPEVIHRTDRKVAIASALPALPALLPGRFAGIQVPNDFLFDPADAFVIILGAHDPFNSFNRFSGSSLAALIRAACRCLVFFLNMLRFILFFSVLRRVQHPFCSGVIHYTQNLSGKILKSPIHN